MMSCQSAGEILLNRNSGGTDPMAENKRNLKVELLRFARGSSLVCSSDQRSLVGRYKVEGLLGCSPSRVELLTLIGSPGSVVDVFLMHCEDKLFSASLLTFAATSFILLHYAFSLWILCLNCFISIILCFIIL